MDNPVKPGHDMEGNIDFGSWKISASQDTEVIATDVPQKRPRVNSTDEPKR